MGYLELTAGDDITLGSTLTGNSHPTETNNSWTGFSIINLDSLVPTSTPTTKRYFIIS